MVLIGEGKKYMMPIRKAVIYIIDEATGKTYPVKTTLTADGGAAYIPASIEKDTVGLATEATLAAIRAQTDNLTFDDAGRIYVANPPNLDIKLSEIRGVGTQSQRTLSDIYDNISSLSSNLTDLKTKSLEEDKHRCYEVTVDDVFAVPSGETWYVKELYISAGELYLDGEVKVV
jgi:hypothetical protein